MKTYKGACHCGAVSFTFKGEDIDKGVRCNCSICKRRGALMSAITFAKEDLKIDAKENSLSYYQFGSGVAKHYFCTNCGIYPFHETMRMPGHFRVNLGCVDEVDTFKLDIQVFDGASL